MPRDSHRSEKRRERSRSRSGSRRKNRSRRKRSDSISASPNHRRGGSVKREVESPRPERPEVRRDSSPEEDGRRAEREVSPPSSSEPAVKDEPGSPRRNGEVADASPRPSPDPEDDVDRKPDIPVERSRSPEKRRRSSDRRERRRDDSRRRRRSRSRDHDGRRGSRSRGKDRRHRRSGEKESRKLPRLVKEDVPAPRRLERSGSHYTPPPRAESDIRTYDDVEYEDDRRSESPEPPRLRSTVVIPDRLPPQEPKVRKKEPDMITTRTGGAYIPPAKLRLMQDQIADKSSVAFQRLAWEALKKSINGLVNKVNVTNLGVIVRELIKENLVRGRGLFCRAIMQAQLASPTFTHVYAGLTAVINTKFPNIGELLLRRLVIQFRRGYKSNNKQVCMNSSRFIAHLVNQQVAHEILALEIVTLLLEKATDDSVEVAIGFLKECGQKLDEVSPKGLRAVSERMRHVLHEGEVAARTQYLIESCFATIKDKFKDHPAVIQELDLVEDDDQYTHFLSLDDEGLQTDDILNVFREDSEFQDNEEKYRDLKREILGDTSSEESGSGSSGSDSSSSEGEDEEEEEGEEGAEKKTEIVDNTETNLIALRRLIYLTIQSSLDFEECAHKLRKLELKPGQEVELCHMILDCCAQQRTYEKFYGLLAQRFCELNKMYVEPFQTMFGECYETCHRFDTNRLRHVAKLFAHLLFTDAISWGVLGQIRLDAENTTSSKRIFIKILFQELVEYMGLQKLHGRINDPTLQEAFRELFPRDDPQATMFAINFFTSIGLGGLTEELREQFKSMTKKPKPPPAAPVVVAEKTGDGEGSSSSSSLSSMSSSSSSSSSDEDGPKKKRRRKDKSKKKTKKTKKRRGSDVSSSESSDEEVKDKKRKKKSERKKASPAKEEEEGGFMGRKGDYWEQIERRRREMEEVARKKALGSMEGRRKDWDRPSLSPPPVNVRKDSDRRRPPSPKRRREDKLPSPRRRKSPSPRGGRRSLSPERKRPKSPARRRRDEKSPSPRRREARSPSPRGRRRSPEHRKPPRGRSASKSPPRKRSPAKSPPRRRSPSKSPPRRKSQSKSPTRKRSVAKSSPKRRSPSKSPPRRRPRHDSDSSPSPRRPRQGENGDRGRKRQHSPSDTSPERPRKKSPPKKTNKREDKSSSSSSSTSSASASSSEESEEDSPPPPKERRREDSEKGKDKRRSPPARRRRRS